MISSRLSLALSMAALPLLVAPLRDEAPPELPPEPPKPHAPRLLSALAGLVGGLPLPPAPRPGSGRERHVRRIQARRLAGQLKLREDDVYQALQRGESEEKIRARADEAKRIALTIPETLGDVYRWLEDGITEEQIIDAQALGLTPRAVANIRRRCSCPKCGGATPALSDGTRWCGACGWGSEPEGHGL